MSPNNENKDEVSEESTPEASQWRIPEWFPELGKEIHDKFLKFLYELIHFNGRMNLISPRTERNADQIHFSDCILGSRIILNDTEAREIYDIGSGNGLPGIVMAILAPKRKIILVEKDARKGEFLKHVSSRLGLKNVEVKVCRLEDLEENSINCAVSRGFASISKAIVSARQRSAVGCRYYHFKGEAWSSEIASIPTQLCSYWEPELVGTYKLPDLPSNLAIILTKKIS